MENQNTLQSIITEGTLIGHELGEWAGFTSGKLVVKKKDGVRVEFRFGKQSHGIIPKIGSFVSIEHPSGNFPEITKITFIESSDIYKEETDSFLDSLFLGKSNGVSLLVLTEVCVGFAMILFGLISGERNAHAPVIFGLCGIPHIIIGYLLWFYAGE
ncbi:MAG: hypothetical protein RTV72_04725 [Candidatus Thorarchaeota archaeon]